MSRHPVVTCEFECQVKGFLDVGPLRERERLVQGVSKAGIDVPLPRWVGVRREAGHRQHQMVAHRVGVRLACLDATDVSVHRIAKRAQQQSQRAVEVVAVSAPALEGDAPRSPRRVDRPALACRYLERLVRHPLDLALHDHGQRLDRWCSGF